MYVRFVGNHFTLSKKTFGLVGGSLSWSETSFHKGGASISANVSSKRRNVKKKLEQAISRKLDPVLVARSQVSATKYGPLAKI